MEAAQGYERWLLDLNSSTPVLNGPSRGPIPQRFLPRLNVVVVVEGATVVVDETVVVVEEPERVDEVVAVPAAMRDATAVRRLGRVS